MPSDKEQRRSKVNGDSWGQQQGAEGVEAPVVFSAEQALGGKRTAIEAIKLAGDSSRLCRCPLGSQQVHIDLMVIALRSFLRTPTPRNLRGSCRLWANQDKLTDDVEEYGD